MNKTKLAIILGTVLGSTFVIGLSALVTYYASRPVNIKKNVYPHINIKEHEEQAAKNYDPNIDDQNTALIKYVNKVINVLNTGLENFPKQKNKQKYEIAKFYFQKAIKLANNANQILENAIKKIKNNNEKETNYIKLHIKLKETLAKANEQLEILTKEKFE
ncbi:hypothetical protein [Mycoplasma enhydrae]|uniref:hypothetical protein n=1 Tax=Mycoplasma enhydrae TaxID=2499220 RepID=UPI00197BB659|nr:hypothetical protein [Mycoplasma enhydrae]MBN4089556.1 hypothetical protein [Mycoplasma enhydrae]